MKSLWDAVGLNCTAVGKLVYRGTGTSYLVMRLAVDKDWGLTSGFLFLGAGFSIGNLPVATGWLMKPSSGTGSYDAGQYGSSLLVVTSFSRRRESG